MLANFPLQTRTLFRDLKYNKPFLSTFLNKITYREKYLENKKVCPHKELGKEDAGQRVRKPKGYRVPEDESFIKDKVR